jgi:hypothetical protein
MLLAHFILPSHRVRKFDRQNNYPRHRLINISTERRAYRRLEKYWFLCLWIVCEYIIYEVCGDYPPSSPYYGGERWAETDNSGATWIFTNKKEAEEFIMRSWL